MEAGLLKNAPGVSFWAEPVSLVEETPPIGLPSVSALAGLKRISARKLSPSIFFDSHNRQSG